MKQSACKQYAEIVCSANQMKPIDSPLERKLPKWTFVLQALVNDDQQTYDVKEEKAIHIPPGEINMNKAVPFFVEKQQGEQGHQEKTPGKLQYSGKFPLHHTK